MTHDDKSREQFEQTLLIMWPNIALGRQQRKPDLYAHDEVQAAWENYRRAALSPASSTGQPQFDKLAGALAEIRDMFPVPERGSDLERLWAGAIACPEEVPGYVQACLAAPAQQAAEAEKWQPIETAPKDQRVLVWSGQEQYAAHWAQNLFTGDEAWIVAEWGSDGEQALVKPTHWMPLPKPPAPDHTYYAALEREHFGDPDKRTGIYHPDNQPAGSNNGAAAMSAGSEG